MDTREIARKVRRLALCAGEDGPGRKDLDDFMQELSLHCLQTLAKYKDSLVSRVATESINKYFEHRYIAQFERELNK